jgi:hypothetical protein
MPGAEPKKYQRRPEATVLYRVIQEHLESFLEHAHESSGQRLPTYVENEFRRYLEPAPAARQAASTCETQRTNSKPQPLSAAALPRAESAPLASSHDASEQLRFMRLSRLTWATLYQRVFDIAPLECSSCGGRMRFVEVIQDIGRARSELRRRDLPDEPPPLSRARSPDWTD